MGKRVKVCGFVQTVRDHGQIVFLDLLDRSGVIQIICQGEIAKGLHPQDVIWITGAVSKRPPHLVNANLSTGSIELQAESLELLSAAAELPFDMGGKELDLQLPTLLDYRSLTLRHPKVQAIFKVQEVVIDAFREFFKNQDFTEFQSPVLIPQAAEGGSEVFEVKYFDHQVYLSQSPQFYKQIMVGVFERVFTVNKTLRAEPSVTTRHLTEVTTLDAEFGFIESWEELMEMAEEAIKYIFSQVNQRCEKELELYGARIPNAPPFIPRIKLREAQKIITKRTKRDLSKEPDLSPEDEREICKWAIEEKDSELVFVTHYPISKRPFYTMEDPDDPGYTLSFDLIGRGTEWLTGGQRIHQLELLTKKAKEKGIDLEKSALYLQAFKYGMPPEGGFSFGSERIVMHILGLANIRQASAFPRDMERVDVKL